MSKLARQIQEVATLRELADVLNANETDDHDLPQDVDMTDLPTFGGSEPDTHGIWSWDKTHVLIQSSAAFVLQPRTECDQCDEYEED